jgi:hypothetical protein
MRRNLPPGNGRQFRCRGNVFVRADPRKSQILQQTALCGESLVGPGAADEWRR